MTERNIIDDEWADKTIPNHDSLIPHALAADESATQTAAARAGMRPLMAIASVIAMAFALPVIGWAAHRPANGNSTDGTETPTTAVAASPPQAATANPANAGPAPSSPAVESWQNSVLAAGRSTEKAHKKHATPTKRTNDRVAGFASAVAGLASAAAEPPGGPLEVPTGAAEPHGNAGPSPRPGAEPKSSPAKQALGRASTRGASGALVEDQAAAELSSALK